MDKVSRWEIAGVPAAMVLSALYELGWLAQLGITERLLPHLMVLCYVVAAGLRSYKDRAASSE